MKERKTWFDLTKHFELETIFPLPWQCHDPNIHRQENTHQAFLTGSPETLHLHGYVLAILPEIEKAPDDDSSPLIWQPLATPVIFRSATDDKKLREWQINVKSTALQVVRENSSSMRNWALRKYRQTGLASPEVERAADIMRFVESLPGKHQAYLEKMSSDLQEMDCLGSATYSLNDGERVIDTRQDDLLVFCYGCSEAVILRPLNGESNKVEFIGLAIIRNVQRLLPAEEGRLPPRPSLCEEMRIMLQAREVLGGIETFAVV